MAAAPQYLDRFNLHLAVKLLGFQPVIDRLDAENKCDTETNTLYWRSKLLLDNPSCLLPGHDNHVKNEWPTGDSNNQNQNHKLLFVDLTFDFSNKDRKNSSNKPSVRFGCFLLQKPTCLYLQGGPLTMRQLEQHAESICIQLNSAPPEAMAGMMANELVAMTATKIVRLDRSQLHLSIFYNEVQDSGKLAMDIAQSTSQLDQVCMQLLSWDLLARDRRQVESLTLSTASKMNHGKSSPEQQELLVKSFEDWFQRLQEEKEEEVRAKRDNTIARQSNSKESSFPPAQTLPKQENITSSSRMAKAKPVSAGRISYGKAPNKRRKKKNKLVYASPNK